MTCVADVLDIITVECECGKRMRSKGERVGIKI